MRLCVSVSAHGCSKGQTFEVSNTSHCLFPQMSTKSALLLNGWYATVGLEQDSKCFANEIAL